MTKDVIGYTEIIWDSLNPKFLKKFIVETDFAEIQALEFRVYDTEEEEVKNGVPTINESRFIGAVKYNFTDIMRSFGKKVGRNLLSNSNNTVGKMLVYGEQVNESREEYNFDISVKNLEKVGGFLGMFKGKFRPQLHFYKVLENNEWIRVYETECGKVDTPSQKFKPVKIDAQTFTNCDKYRQIKLELVHHTSGDEDDYQDELVFTIEKLAAGQLKYNFKKNPKQSVEFANFRIKPKVNWLDYFQYGLNLNLLVGIDFTASNGQVNTPNSLHKITQYGYNDYQNCLMAVSNILIQYDTDKIVPMYGFGMNLNNRVSHCEPMWYQGEGFLGVEQLMFGYTNFIQNPSLRLSGPTNFSPILRRVINEINVNEYQNYYVLLMITDGQITDFYDTIDTIVECSYLPISIVIVGVGNADFQRMDVLDDDDGELKDQNGRKPMRDCVQFVEFNKCNHDPNKLRREVLYEIPDQVTQYYEKRNITTEMIFQCNPQHTQLQNANEIDYGVNNNIVIPNM